MNYLTVTHADDARYRNQRKKINAVSFALAETLTANGNLDSPAPSISINLSSFISMIYIIYISSAKPAILRNVFFLALTNRIQWRQHD